MSDYISREAITEWRPKNIEIINSRAYIDLEELLDLVDGIPAPKWSRCGMGGGRVISTHATAE